MLYHEIVIFMILIGHTLVINTRKDSDKHKDCHRFKTKIQQIHDNFQTIRTRLISN